jgi:class III poly(R)-hydroxyalkanoic acid synthase PhaE subunit
MSDPDDTNGGHGGGNGANGAWVRDWVRQQRDLLERAASASPDEGAATGASADPWIDLAATWHRVWAGVQSLGDATVQGFAQALQQLPAVGLAREQTLAWREVAAAQAACLRLESELRAVLTRVQSDALTLLEQRVSERRAAGRQVGSMRELYDLWVECGEQLYAKVAHSDEYCRLQGEVANAATHLRACQQRVIEHGLRHFDLPTRSELNTLHRQVRELREKLAEYEARPAAGESK